MPMHGLHRGIACRIRPNPIPFALNLNHQPVARGAITESPQVIPEG
jgi:hypothetical protein